MGGGAWPFLVRGVICLVNSANERDLDLLNSTAFLSFHFGEFFFKCFYCRLLRGTTVLR